MWLHSLLSPLTLKPTISRGRGYADSSALPFFLLSAYGNLLRGVLDNASKQQMDKQTNKWKKKKKTAVVGHVKYAPSSFPR